MTDQASEAAANTKSEDRSDLLAKARSFLASPQVQHQDIKARRAFLVEKGLNDAEIEELLRAIPAQLPSIPPRTYPQPPPSNLPALLLGLVRLFSWLAGGSAVLVLLYHRLLLPRIAQTSLARHSLRSYHLSLLRRLTASLAALKESQAESFSVLPRSSPLKEPPRYDQSKSVSDAIPSTPQSPPPSTRSLDALLYELPKDIKTRKSLFQHTLQFLSDFTGEISAQVYLPYRPPTMGTGLSSATEKSSIEDELRREIRALKGLALNRRSFMPSIPRSTGPLV